MPQSSGYARFELQINNIAHGYKDTVYGKGLFFKVQNRPDIMQGLLANDQVIEVQKLLLCILLCQGSS